MGACCRVVLKWSAVLACGTVLACVAGAATPKAAPSVTQVKPALPPIKLAMVEGLSGPFANTGEAVYRNLLWAVERVNQRGGVKLPNGARELALVRHDSKGQTEEALSAFRAAVDEGAGFVLQGNSSAVAAALIEATNKHNEREPERRVRQSHPTRVFDGPRLQLWSGRFTRGASPIDGAAP
jgi:branched-chain amino acid transport system substrate-binding protein